MKFNSKSFGLMVGALQKVNIKKAIVKTSTGDWRVPLAMLTAA